MRMLLALNTYPSPVTWQKWQRAVDLAVDYAVAAIMVADRGLMHYAASKYPQLVCSFRRRAQRPIVKPSILCNRDLA